MNTFQQIMAWLAQNRRTIFTVLIVLLLLRICTGPAERSHTSKEETITYAEPGANQLKSFDQLQHEQIEKYRNQESPTLLPYILMVALAAALFLIQRKKLLRLLKIQRVAVASKVIKANKTVLVKLEIENRTQNTIEATTPTLVFSNLIHTKKFRLNNTDFPMLLAPGTSHSITFAIDKIIEIQSDLNSKPFIHVELTTGQKTHRTLPKLWK